MGVGVGIGVGVFFEAAAAGKQVSAQRPAAVFVMVYVLRNGMESVSDQLCFEL